MMWGKCEINRIVKDVKNTKSHNKTVKLGQFFPPIVNFDSIRILVFCDVIKSKKIQIFEDVKVKDVKIKLYKISSCQFLFDYNLSTLWYECGWFFSDFCCIRKYLKFWRLLLDGYSTTSLSRKCNFPASSIRIPTNLKKITNVFDVSEGEEAV